MEAYRTPLSKVLFLIAVILAIFATFSHSTGDVNPGWAAVAFIAAGLLVA